MNKKNKILLEAVILQEEKVAHLKAILKEALSNPIFKSYSQFENELEYQLFESVAFGAGRALANTRMNVRGGGTYSMFGKYGEILQNFSNTEH